MDDKYSNINQSPAEGLDGNLTAYDGAATVETSPSGDEDFHENEVLQLGSNAFKAGVNIFSELTQKPSDKYKFIKSIGYGGMKTILQVKDKDTARDLAMAIMADAENKSLDDKRRFLQEARITAKLEHPNIVPIHDIGIDSSGSPYFTMKLIKGEALSAIIKKLNEGDPEYLKKYDLNSLLRFFIRISNAVAFAHSKKVLHLDLKPENIQIGDFGEVILMDWGLARIQSGDSEADNEKYPQERAAPRKKDENITMDGITKGTPGFMAPEQASGINRLKNERTDIYSLGAILYAMLTYTAPFEGKNIEKILKETVRGHLIPPRVKKPRMLIPGAMEAVVLKAMALRPSERYQTVVEMRDDVLAYINGFATVAEKASFAKRTFLYIKRHRVVATFITIIIFLLLSLGIFTVQDHFKRKGDWVKIFQMDFSDINQDMSGISFMDKLITSNTQPWLIDIDGLKMEQFNWMWLKNIIVKESSRVIVKVITKGTSDAIEICLNGKIQPVSSIWNFPTGYSMQCGGDGGTRDVISKSDDGQSTETLTTVETGLIPDVEHEIIFQKKGEELSISIDGRESIKIYDLFPPLGRDLDKVGLRSFSNSTWIKSIDVYRLSIPEKASPLIAGDTLVELQLFKEAIDKYTTTAENYGTSIAAEKALTKAYITAATKLSDTKERQEILMSIKKSIRERFQSFGYSEIILETDAIIAWRNKNYKRAFTLVYEILKLNQYSDIMPRILQGTHEPLPPAIGRELLFWISKTKNLKRLNISNLDIRDLDPLSELKLIFLDCSGNKLKSLDPIKNMPLETLSCASNKLKDLGPLEDMPIKDLNCSNNQIENLKPLDQMPLKVLDCSTNKIYSLDPLEHSYLEKLNCSANMITDLDPVRGLKLKYLNCAENQIHDIEPASRMPLESLIFGKNMVVDIAPLSEMQIKTIECAYNRISSLEPLKENLKLESLFCSNNSISDLNPIALLSALNSLDCSNNPIKDIEPLKGLPLKMLKLTGCNNISDFSVLLKIKTLEDFFPPDSLKDPEIIKELSAVIKK
ncbi:MAG: hypothetical protein A2020_13455 [Lentisphaerae bacterium GWF2_45_14]|nr:MAG: hypothetical protein A2020_13455 [Lentisphaerae bacterium GWF2_45_14]